MLVGLDLDNTIIHYDRLFHRVALDSGLIPTCLPATKLCVRDHLRKIGREDDWTEMQGSVYGPRMADAEPFPGVLEFLRFTRSARIIVCIVSHRTRFPFRGPQHDLHQSAREWINVAFHDAEGPLVAPENVYLELTKEAKIARIAELGCTHFVDDLPEILLSPQFPIRTRGILFDPDGLHSIQKQLPSLSTWSEIAEQIAADAD